MGKRVNETCPWCYRSLLYRYPGSDRTYNHAVPVRIPTVYPGYLYWECPYCEGKWHMFGEGTKLHEKAKRYVDNDNAQQERPQQKGAQKGQPEARRRLQAA